MEFRKLRADEIDVRVAQITDKTCSLLLYKDARVDQNILDETVGPANWERSHQLIGENLYCTVSIYDMNKECWVSKQDVGTESYTEKEKGQASDSFKRACFNWGIGRELYTAPRIKLFASNGSYKADKNSLGKAVTYDSFSVKSIDYDRKGNIKALEILNDSQGSVVFSYRVPELISEKEQMILKNLCSAAGLDINKTFPNGLEAINEDQYVEAVKNLKKYKAKNENNKKHN